MCNFHLTSNFPRLRHSSVSVSFSTTDPFGFYDQSLVLYHQFLFILAAPKVPESKILIKNFQKLCKPWERLLILFILLHQDQDIGDFKS